MTKDPVGTVAVECRHPDDGHVGRLDTARHALLVASDSRPGVTHGTRIATPAPTLSAAHTRPAGRHARHGTAVSCCDAARDAVAALRPAPIAA